LWARVDRWCRITSDKVWQDHESEYMLVSCTVALGFEFNDFDLPADDPEEQALVRARFPELAGLI